MQLAMMSNIYYCRGMLPVTSYLVHLCNTKTLPECPTLHMVCKNTLHKGIHSQYYFEVIKGCCTDAPNMT